MAHRIFLPVLLPILVVAGFLLLSWTIAAASGWRRLASSYADQMPFESVQWVHARAHLRRGTPLNFKLELRLGCDRQNLYLRTWPFILPGYAQLCVPWQDVSAQDGQIAFWKLSALQFRAQPGISLRISHHALESVVSRAGGRWVNHQPQFPA